jgi:hypothetical protein
MSVRRAASTVGLASLASLTTAAALDAADDTLVYLAVTARPAALALASPAVAAALGPPVAVGPWWRSALAAPLRTRTARATFEVVGGRGGADVTVVAVPARRVGGLAAFADRWREAGWTLVSADVTLPTGVPGPARGWSLLEEETGGGGEVTK